MMPILKAAKIKLSLDLQISPLLSYPQLIELGFKLLPNHLSMTLWDVLVIMRPGHTICPICPICRLSQNEHDIIRSDIHMKARSHIEVIFHICHLSQNEHDIMRSANHTEARLYHPSYLSPVSKFT